MDEVEEIVGAVAAKHGILIGKDDPAIMIPTLVAMGIERGVRRLSYEDAARQREMKEFLASARAESLKAIEAEASAIAAKIRDEVKFDLDKAGASAATLVANVNHAHSRPMRIYWTSVGMFAAIVLFAIGVLVGKFLL